MRIIHKGSLYLLFFYPDTIYIYTLPEYWKFALWVATDILKFYTLK